MLRLEDVDPIDFDCKLTDLVCVAFESQARGLGSFLGWLAGVVLGDQELAPGSALWNDAIEESGNWFAIAIMVMLTTGVIGLATGMISMKGRNVWITLGGLAAAIPSTYLALGVGGALLEVTDEMSKLTLERLGGADGFANLIRAGAQRGTGSDVAGALQTIASGPSGGSATIIMMLFLIVGMVLMAFSIAFRNLGIMILIAFAPLAFMAVPLKGGWGLTKKWGLAFIALLLAKPLMFGVLAMLMKSSGEMTLFSPQTLTVVTGLFVVSFMPMMAYSFFNFLGSGNENMAGQGMAGQAAGKTTAVLRGAGNVAGRGLPGAAGKAGGAAASTPKPSGGAPQAASAEPAKPQGGKSTSGSTPDTGSAGSGSTTPAKPANGQSAPASPPQKSAPQPASPQPSTPQVPASPKPAAAPAPAPPATPAKPAQPSAPKTPKW